MKNEPIYGDERVDYNGWTLRHLHDKSNGQARFALGVGDQTEVAFTSTLEDAVKILTAFGNLEPR